MNPPKIENLANCIKYYWGEGDGFLTATVSNIRNHRDGHTSGELLITTTAPGFLPHIVQDTLNLSAKLSRSRLARELSNQYNHVAWDDILEYICVKTIRIQREGEPVQELIRKNEEVVTPGWALRPVLPLNQPTVLFGDGGVCKGYLALLLANCLRGVYDDNPFGFERSDITQTVLYLDYETERTELLLRQECLCAGLEIPITPPILYRRQYIPFAEDISRIQSLILDMSARTIIIDSIGAACAAELNSSETALRFFSALRSLKNVTSILIAHTSKNEEGRKTPYGSAFFRNYARSVWEVRKSQDADSSHVSVGIFQTKSNNSRLSSPVGMDFIFNSDDDDNLQSVQVIPQDVKTVSEFIDKLSLKIQLKELLKNGALTIKELAELSGSKPGNIRTTLEREKNKTFVKLIGEKEQKWGLFSSESITCIT